MKFLQADVFRSVEELLYQPLVLAYGLGVDSTAVLIALRKRSIRPDAILFADTGDEKKETYDYLPIINDWLAQVGFPQVTVVRYKPKAINGTIPYHTLGQNCLFNSALPALAFGWKTCSLKWKVEPQNRWTNNWPMALDCWARGIKVRKIIGYDASPKDLRRYAHAKIVEDPKYDYWYPLVEWKMDREACKAIIAAEGLPIPPKSACIFCPATKPEELLGYRKPYLRTIVLMEALAAPRLQGLMNESQLEMDYQIRLRKWETTLAKATPVNNEKLINKKPKKGILGKGCSGLWRSATKKRPAMMTDFIISEDLLTIQEVNNLRKLAFEESAQLQQLLQSFDIPMDWHDLLEQFTEEDAQNEQSSSCSSCHCI